jgi:NADH:ubiquinone oxidoreductase subunit C
MDNILLKERLEGLSVDALFPPNPQYPEIIVPVEKYHEFCSLLKTSGDLLFDYLISLTAVDWKDHYIVVCHITSTSYRHLVVVKTRLDNHEDPVVDTISDIWRTAEFHEREVFDLFGIRFRNHPDLRRLFLEDGYGFPLRKDFTDDSRMIVR